MRIARYGKTRFWAVYDGATLVCVCLYKKGAQEVLRRLTNCSHLPTHTCGHPMGKQDGRDVPQDKTKRKMKSTSGDWVSPLPLVSVAPAET
jgi:hypothetical protein